MENKSVTKNNEEDHITTSYIINFCGRLPPKQRTKVTYVLVKME